MAYLLAYRLQKPIKTHILSGHSKITIKTKKEDYINENISKN